MTHKSRSSSPRLRLPAALRAAFTLSSWRWRTQWVLLTVTGVGIMTAVMLMGMLPLFSSVMTTAGLRNILRANPNSAQIVATTMFPFFSSQIFRQANTQIDQVVQQDIGSNLQGGPQISLQLPAWGPPQGATRVVPMVILFSSSSATIPTHIHVLQGHLPVASRTQIEILLTTSSAQEMHLHVGDTFTLQSTFVDTPANRPRQDWLINPPILIQLVGLFQTNPNDAYWHGTNFAPPGGRLPFTALTSNEALSTFIDSLGPQQSDHEVYLPAPGTYTLFLAYSLHTSLITSSDLDALISHVHTLQEDTASDFNSFNGMNPHPPHLAGVTLSGPILDLSATTGNPGTLVAYRAQMDMENIPSLLLTAQIACLILLFIAMMAGTLVEQQQHAIALMRSRGASRWQLLGSLLVQSAVLCLCAGLAGPLLALVVVLLLAPHLLTTTNSDALNVLTLHANQMRNEVVSYTLPMVLSALVTLICSLALTLRATVLTQRRKAARATRHPFWQRFRLDLAMAVLALLSYVLAVSVEQTSQLLGVQAQTLVLVPLKLLAPLLLVVAGLLVFARLFPWLLRLFARLTQHGKNLSSMLALVQLERSPRHALLMTLLLGLTIAFTLFALVFSATLDQHAQALATYQAGSDFSGTLTPTLSGQTTASMSPLVQITATYQHLPGVTSVTVGSQDQAYFTGPDGTSQVETIVQAVNAQTFAQTVRWSAQDSSQPLSDLMAQLVARRTQANAHQIVPAIIAANTWQALGLHPGALFHLSNSLVNTAPVTYLALAKVAHLPPAGSDQNAILVDYQTLANAEAAFGQILQPNYLWLCSSNAPTDLDHLRHTLTAGRLELGGLQDRRALAAANINDPLTVNLLLVLDVGVLVALLLALLATVLLPLLSVRARLTNFAVLRALGTQPTQIKRVLLWEQGIVLGSSLTVGLALGLVLAWSAVPPLIFTSASSVNSLNASATSIFALQQIIPITVSIPPVLLLALAVLILLGALTLQLLAFLIQRPLLGQTLRLNED